MKILFQPRGKAWAKQQQEGGVATAHQNSGFSEKNDETIPA